MLNEILERQMKQAQDATSGLPKSLVDNPILPASMAESGSGSGSSSRNPGAAATEGSGAASVLISGSKSEDDDLVVPTNLTTVAIASATAIATAAATAAALRDNENKEKEKDFFLRRLDEGGSVSPIETQQQQQQQQQAAAAAALAAAAATQQQQQKQQQSDLAHHMLRNILQSKKDLIALDKELRSVISHHRTTNYANLLQNPASATDCTSEEGKQPHHMNPGGSNPCENLDSAIIDIGLKCVGELMNIPEDCSAVRSQSEPNLPTATANIGGIPSRSTVTEHERLSDSNYAIEGLNLSIPGECPQQSFISDIWPKKEAEDELEDELMVLGSRSDLHSIGSPIPPLPPGMMTIKNPKDDDDDEDDDDDDPTTSQAAGTSSRPIVLDMKRARVENIVSSIQPSPSSSHHSQVNGCKKRKLYQPQQHAMERYASASASATTTTAAAAAATASALNLGQEDPQEEHEEQHQIPLIQQKRVQKNALKLQLRTMREQLAEMQQKYVQLCSRMEQESDDTISDDGNHGLVSPALSLASSTHKKSSSSPEVYVSKQQHQPMAIAATPPVLSQMMSKFITSKIHSPVREHSHLQQALNPKSSMLQHNILPHIPVEDPSAHVTDPTMSTAAAMYLGQHFLLEQEVRVAKEAAEQRQIQQQQQQQQQRQHQQQKEQHELRQKLHQQQQQQRSQTQQRESQQQQQQQRQLSTDDIRVLESQAAASIENQLLNSQYYQRLRQPQRTPVQTSPQSSIKSEISEKFNMLRSQSSSSTIPLSGSDLEGLADALKSEISASLSALVDTIVTRCVQQRQLFRKQSQTVASAADQLSKDILKASQVFERKATQTQTATSTANVSSDPMLSSISPLPTVSVNIPKQTDYFKSSQRNIIPTISSHPSSTIVSSNVASKNVNERNKSHFQQSHSHPTISPSTALFETPKTSSSQSMTSLTPSSLYSSIGLLGSGVPHTNPINPFFMPESREQNVEQNEALSLVVTPKKKRHKVTDTRITPRTVSRLLAQDGSNIGQNLTLDTTNLTIKQSPQTQTCSSSSKNTSAEQTTTTLSKTSSSPLHPSPYLHQPAQQQMIPTFIAIPNPSSSHESQVFSPYSPFYSTHHHGTHGPSNIPTSSAAAQIHHHHHMKMTSSPSSLVSNILDNRPRSPPPPPMLHPALLGTQHRNPTPTHDYSVHLRAAMDAVQDQNPSDFNPADLQFEGMQPTISFLKQQMLKSDSSSPLHSSTLTPMHLRKAKLMFFWVRYPSSAVLKMYFPDIKFNKNNTAQLVKWFSNFREFYYIQMEKYARQAVTEGVQNAEDLHVGGDSELYRVLNLHYNRNNHIEVPTNFRFVVEQTLREFFRAIQGGKDTEQSWKKSIYKVISRMDDPVPEYFKSPNFLEQLE